ncbi:phosphatase PAP2 family protein [Limosilactobacillus viscerum]|uniref:phosphatase PAP2 family protein n=1 Tax=Limosilactobacillus viscerum TaxID=2993450 RepID=UPI0024B88028|nr:phosphatase PAP2 family protein [Limosilactobacillus viscerum]
MFIERDSHRMRRFLLSGGFFIILLLLIKFNSSVVTMMDAVLQSLFTSQRLEGAGWFHALMTLLSFLASPKMDLLWVFIIAVVLWLKHFQIPALWAIGTILGGDVLGEIAKHIVKRARPAQHLAADDGYSFPSGHTLGIFLVAAIILLIVLPLIQRRSIRTICQILIVFVIFFLAISRVYLYAHWPFDTISAMLLAYAWLQVAEWLYVAWAPRLQRVPFLSSSYI